MQDLKNAQMQTLLKLRSGYSIANFARIICPGHALVTHTDTDSADATDGPSVSIRNGPYRIRRVRNCPYRIRRVAGSASKFSKVSKFSRGRVNRNDP